MILIWYKTLISLLVFWHNAQKIPLYEGDVVTDIHSQFSKIVLNYNFNVVDVDYHCIYLYIR